MVCIHHTRAPAARREVETECPGSPHQLPWSIQQSRDKKAFSLRWKERTKFQELSSDLHMSIVACVPYPHTDSNSKIKKNKSGPQVSQLVNTNLPLCRLLRPWWDNDTGCSGRHRAAGAAQRAKGWPIALNMVPFLVVCCLCASSCPAVSLYSFLPNSLRTDGDCAEVTDWIVSLGLCLIEVGCNNCF